MNGCPLSGSASATCSGAPLTLGAEVGGLAITLPQQGVECISSVITAPGSVSETLRFTGVTVEKPSTKCTVPGGDITTNPMRITLLEVPGRTHLYLEVLPAGGTEYFTLPINSCAIAGEYPFEGSIAGEGEVWGTELVEQSLTFGPGIDTVTGHHLTFGGENASLTGTAKIKLTSGVKFGAL